MRRGLTAGLAVLAVAVSGCGGGHDGARTVTQPRATRAHEIVALKRWVGTDPVVSEVVVASDGTARTRQVVGGLSGMRNVTNRLAADRFARVRELVAHARLRGADTVAEPVAGGYAYILRIGDRSVRTADGHLAPGVRPLITELDRLWDRARAG